EKQVDVASMLTALGRLWLSGVPVDWPGFYAHERRYRLPLPAYPFERKRFWVEPAGIDGNDNQAQPVGAHRLADSSSIEEESDLEAGKPRFDAAQSGRTDTLSQLKAVFQELSGVDLSHSTPSATFLELGFDSLFLTQASQAVQRRFGASVSFRQLLEEFPTLEILAAHLEAQKSMARQRNGSPPPGASENVEPAAAGSSAQRVETGTAEMR